MLKRETHRVALVEAATSGNPRFFLGTDSAPHPKGLKEHACGCAGCYTALHALELYTEAFDKAGALDKLEGFASFYGADFYGLPRSAENGDAASRDVDAAGRIAWSAMRKSCRCAAASRSAGGRFEGCRRSGT